VVEFRNRLSELRRKKRLTQKELGKVFGLSKQAISSYEKGDSAPTHETLKKMAEFFGVTTDYLLGRTDDPRPLNDFFEMYPVGRMIRVPIVGTVKAGPDGLAFEEFQGYECTEEAGLGDGKYFFLRVNGDSMVGEGILPGDLVLVRQQSEIEDGGLAVVIVDDEQGMLKRVYRRKESFILQAANPAYRPVVVSVNRVRIVGKVKRMVRNY